MMTAEKLISEGAFWNGGVFAFRLGYMIDIVARYIQTDILRKSVLAMWNFRKSVLTTKSLKKRSR